MPGLTSKEIAERILLEGFPFSYATQEEKNTILEIVEQCYFDNMGDFWDEQAEWSRATFGADTERGPIGPLKHLRKEVEEAIAEVSDNYPSCGEQPHSFKATNSLTYPFKCSTCGLEVSMVFDSKRLYEEITDCLFLVFDAARCSGMEYEDLVTSAFTKLAKNKARKWGKPTSDEPVEHVREERRRCQCGSDAREDNGCCGPMGCYNVPA